VTRGTRTVAVVGLLSLILGAGVWLAGASLRATSSPASPGSSVSGQSILWATDVSTDASSMPAAPTQSTIIWATSVTTDNAPFPTSPPGQP
jgi:hypothetical protein